MKKCPLFGLLISFLAIQAFADIYSWTDKNGVKHYSNDPPPSGEPVTGIIRMEETKEETAPQVEDTTGQKEPATQANTAGRQIYIYVNPQSEYCNQALAFFDQNKIPYNKIDITASEADMRRFQNVQGESVPLIFIDEQRIDGWNEEQVRKTLGLNAQPTAAEKTRRALDATKK
jgi:glutaredoxin